MVCGPFFFQLPKNDPQHEGRFQFSGAYAIIQQLLQRVYGDFNYIKTLYWGFLLHRQIKDFPSEVVSLHSGLLEISTMRHFKKPLARGLDYACSWNNYNAVLSRCLRNVVCLSRIAIFLLFP